MSILQKHLAARFAVAFTGSLGVLVAVILILEFLLDLDEILELETTALGVISFLATRVLALYFSSLIPIAAFTGTFIAIGLAARAHEITAMKAGGVSPLQVSISLLGLACVISVATFVVSETVVISASEKISRAASGESTEINVRHGRIWYNTGPYIYNIARIQGDEIFDIRVYERDTLGRLIRTIEADRGYEAGPREWHFTNAVVRLYEPERPQNPPTVTRSPEMKIALDKTSSLQTIQTSVLNQPLWVLHEQINWDRASPAIRAAFHQRLSSAPLCLLLVLLAIPLGISVERTRSLAGPALKGIACIALLIAMREYSAGFSPAHYGSAVLTPWLSIAILTSYATWRLWKTPQ